MKNLDRSLLSHIVGGLADGPIEAATHNPWVEAGATGAAIGGGIAGALVIDAAPSLASLGGVGITAGSAYGAGLVATGVAGYTVGTVLYDNNVLWIKDAAIGAVGAAFDFAAGAAEYYTGIGEHSCGVPMADGGGGAGGNLRDFHADYNWE